MYLSPSTSISSSTETFVRTILLVDDEELIRLIAAEFLQDCGYHVLQAANVAQAKDILVRKSVDVVFSDINMPGSETGFALEKWIRRHFPDIKVLLTSGFPHVAADTGHLLEPLIAKPYSISSVLRRIETLSRVDKPAAARQLAVA
jgi:DNA-binding NtrC family response regulator